MYNSNAAGGAVKSNYGPPACVCAYYVGINAGERGPNLIMWAYRKSLACVLDCPPPLLSQKGSLERCR